MFSVYFWLKDKTNPYNSKCKDLSLFFIFIKIFCLFLDLVKLLNYLSLWEVIVYLVLLELENFWEELYHYLTSLNCILVTNTFALSWHKDNCIWFRDEVVSVDKSNRLYEIARDHLDGSIFGFQSLKGFWEDYWHRFPIKVVRKNLNYIINHLCFSVIF